MHLTSLLPFVGLALATPLPHIPYAPLERRQEPLPNTTDLYYLRTQTTDNSSAHNNLYIASYHTGAGLGDAVLIPKEQNVTWPGTLNGTAFQYVFGGEDFPWNLNPNGAAGYAAWAPVTLDAAAGPVEGFYFNETDGTGLLWNSVYPNAGTNESQFGGWLGKFLFELLTR